MKDFANVAKDLHNNKDLANIANVAKDLPNNVDVIKKVVDLNTKLDTLLEGNKGLY